MKRLFLICSIIIFLFFPVACNPISTPADYDLTIITYAYSYRPDIVDISFLAEKSNGNYTFTWIKNGLPTYEDILAKPAGSPSSDLEIKIIDEVSIQKVSGATDKDGHLSLSVPFQQGTIIPNGLVCEEITSWTFPEEGSNIEGGGGVLFCSQERKTFSS